MTDTTSIVAYAPIFISAGDIYAVTDFDAASISEFKPTNPIDPLILGQLREDYANGIDDVFGNLELNAKSIDAKDSITNYSLSFDATSDATEKGNVTLTVANTLAKDVEFGSGNEAVKELITYNNTTFGDKLVVNHNYSVQTITDKKDADIILSLKKSDSITQIFTADTGANAISSTLTRVSSYSENLAQGTTDILTIKDQLTESFKFKSPTIAINSKHTNATSSVDDVMISKLDTYNVDFINSDKDAELAYKLNYGVSINNDAVKDKVIMTLNKFSFSDSSISINAKGVIDGDAVSNGNLKVTTANFSLNTKVLLASTFENMLLAGEYGDKATFEDVFGITTEFQGTDDADVIKINTVKTTVTKAPSRLDTTDLIQLTLSVDAKGGNDTITGSAGADSITGGEGNDVFVIGNKDSGSITITSTVTTTNVDGTTIEYEAEAINSDTITDFKGSEIDDSEKVIKGDVLSLGVAGSAANYDEATEAVGDFSAALTSANDALSKLTAKGERFAFQFDEESGYLFNDVNGDGKADQVIILTGVTNEGIAAIDIVK
jgi:hypothetical protein